MTTRFLLSLALGLCSGHLVEHAEVALADGSRKQLQDIAVGDEVMSYDEALQRTAPSRVVSIFESWSLPQDLVEVPPGLSSGRTSLLVTKAQPVWSSSQGRVVSASPNQTREEYGLEAGSLAVDQELELEQDAGQGRPPSPLSSGLGRVLPTRIRVLTLGLSPHHWFYVEGLRVHNKGTSSGSSSSSSSSSTSSRRRSTSSTSTQTSTVQTQQSMGSSQYASHVVRNGGNRRRRGTYRDEGGLCNMRNESEVAEFCRTLMEPSCSIQGTGNASNIRLLLGDQCCHSCLECEVESCISQYSGCEEFLGNAFESCEETTGDTATIVASLLSTLCCCCCCCGGCCGAWYFFFKKAGGGSRQELEARRRTREDMQADQGTLPASLTFSGSYNEDGTQKATTYVFNFQFGRFDGTGTDADGQARVTGKVSIPNGALQGVIRWEELRGDVAIEAVGTLRQQQPSPGMFTIEADYVSSYKNAKGSLYLTSAGQGPQFPGQGPQFTGQAAVGAPVVVPVVVGQAVVPGEVA